MINKLMQMNKQSSSILYRLILFRLIQFNSTTKKRHEKNVRKQQQRECWHIEKRHLTLSHNTDNAKKHPKQIVTKQSSVHCGNRVHLFSWRIIAVASAFFLGISDNRQALPTRTYCCISAYTKSASIYYETLSANQYWCLGVLNNRVSCWQDLTHTGQGLCINRSNLAVGMVTWCHRSGG
jgi:hypothetical protein